MGTHYPTYRPTKELTAERAANCLRFNTVIAAASSDFGPEIVLTDEALWLTRFRKIVYYLPLDVTDFMLGVKVDGKLSDVPALDIFGVSPHPASGVPPMLVELSSSRCIVHIHGFPDPNGLPRHGTTSGIFYDGFSFSPIDDEWDAKVISYKDSKEHVSGGHMRPEMRQAIKVAYTSWVYRKAFPDLVFDGFPEDMKERAIRYAGKVTGRRIDLPERIKKLRDSRGRLLPGSHLRHEHLRHLGHERFRRNPDGSVRVVLVSEAVVGKDTTPKHIRLEDS